MRRSDRIALAPGYMLHGRQHGEASLILDCFCREHGRVALVARGARRAGAALRGVLQPFSPLSLSWVSRGELGTLTGAESHNRLHRPAGENLFAAFYANELLLRALAPHDPHPGVFDAYALLLARLSGGGSPHAPLRAFELALLDDIGYATELERCADDGAPVQAGQRYIYRPAHGVLRAGVEDLAPDCFDGEVLLALARAELADAGLLREARRVTRLALDHALGQRPLRTRAVLRQLRRPARAGGGQP